MPKKVNITTPPNLLDLIAPHTCRGCGQTGTILCNQCKNYIIQTRFNLCPFCKTATDRCSCTMRLSFPPIFIVSWRNSPLGALIKDLKYSSAYSAAKPLAEILYHILKTQYTHPTIVPLPTISKHIRKRGLDHTRLIAKHLAKHFGPNTLVANLLIRANSTTQVGSTREERLQQAQKAYRINPKAKIDKNVTYLLIDDVWTTGASMIAAVMTLQKHGIKNLAIAVLALSK